MKLFGKNVPVDIVLNFVDSLSNPDCWQGFERPNPDDLIYQAAVDLAAEVRRLRDRYETIHPPIKKDSDDYICPHCHRAIDIKHDTNPKSIYCNHCGTHLRDENDMPEYLKELIDGLPDNIS